MLSISDSAGALGKRAIVLLVMLSANGCTGSGHESLSPDRSAPQSKAPASQNGTTTDGALAAYTGMWSDLSSAADTANWQNPALPRHATEEALAEMTSGLYSLKQKGLVTHGAPVLHPQITGSSPTAADISDCASTTAWLTYVAATGKLENNVPGGKRLIQAHVELADGVWRVVSYTVGDLGSC